MNALFLTQSKTLSLFFDVARIMQAQAGLKKAGFYIADFSFFDKYRKENPALCSGELPMLKEWELLARASHTIPNLERLKAYEKRLGDPVLWNALISDRRIYLGKKSALEQDYKPRFRVDQMLSILEVGINEMEKFFDKVSPNLVVGFICVTLGDYLAYLIAQSRSIPLINLRPTRIKNFFYGGESIYDPSSYLEHQYHLIRDQYNSGDSLKVAQNILTSIRETHSMYEGVLPATTQSASMTAKKRTETPENIAQKIKLKWHEFCAHRVGKSRNDTHYNGAFYPFWFQKIKKPLRVRKIERSLRKIYVKQEDLSKIEYAFYPLHKEPEVTLLVYSSYYLNQIEVIRNLARSLPVGMKLIVKEHPASRGYRPLSYYRKVLDIPNVLLASVELNSRSLVNDAKLVAVISGSIGLEAIMLKKPVVVFGGAPYSFLPSTMVRKIGSLDRLAYEIQDLLESHHHDEKMLLSYIAAVQENSIPIDFYSSLLERPGAYREESKKDGGLSRENQIHALSNYLLKLTEKRRTFQEAKRERVSSHA